jgi:hypothetical protein
MAANKKQQIVTPKATAVYPWLNTPDTKFNVDGEYKVTLKIGSEEAAPLIEKIDGAIAEYKQEQATKDPKVGRYSDMPPYEEEVDDQGNLTGNVLFKFKQKAKIHTKDGRTIDMKVALFDAQRTPTDVIVGGGSEIKVAATLWPYVLPTTKSVGVSLRPSAVQILTLVSAGGSKMADLFDSEDGFVASNTNAAPSFDEEEDGDAADF